MHDPEGGLVVGADDAAWQAGPRCEERRDRPGPAGCAVVADPLRALVSDTRARPPPPPPPAPGLVVRAVDVPRHVPEAAEPVIESQVADQRSHSALVVTAHAQHAGGRLAGQGHDGRQRGEVGELWRRDHAVMDDQPIRLARQNLQPGRGIAAADQRDEHVETDPVRRGLDTTIHDLVEERALVLARELGLLASAEHHADDLLQPAGERERRSVRHVAELADRLHDPLPRVDRGLSSLVEDPRNPGDRQTGASGDVVDGRALSLPQGHFPCLA